jgi:PIN domain nuclease of toxin-antitoxin system
VKLSVVANALLTSSSNDILISSATAWEISTKYRLGKLTELDRLPAGPGPTLLADLAAERFSPLAITPAHGVRAGEYDLAHGDPFDRILAAQSELEGVPLVTRDPAFAQFPCETLW